MQNLSAEMVRFGVGISDIQNLLGCSNNTVRNKLNGISEFSVGEAMKIRNKFFPGFKVEYLFAENNTPPGPSKKAGRESGNGPAA